MTMTTTQRLDSLSTAVPFAQKDVRTAIYTTVFSASQTYVTGGATIDASADFATVTSAVAHFADTANTLTDIVAKVVDISAPAALCFILKRDGSGAAELAAGTAIPNASVVTLIVTGTSV